MKKILTFLILLSLAKVSISQLTIQSGATFVIQGGAVVTVQGDVVTNNDIQGTGTLQFKGTALQNLFANGFTIPNIQIDNTNNVSLGSNVTIGTNFLFTNGKFLLNTANLSLASAATITGFDNTKYFVTNGTGHLVKNSLGAVAFTFPVGFDAATYNPLTITQNGTAENIGVKVNQNVLQNGTSGSAFVKEVVDASWDLTESVAGANNVTMTAGWAGTDELTGFNRNKTGISFFDGVGWDMTNAMTAAASGGGPYSITRSSVANLGVFAVGTRPVLTQLLVSPKTFLQGAYAGGGLMNDGLRAAGIIPLSEPYTAMSANFTQSGSGGGESIPSSVLSSTGTGVDIVDWVFVELRNGTTGSVITTHSAIIQRDGNVVDVDGTNTKVPYIIFTGELPTSYFVAIRHRNHLGIRTAGNLALSRTVTTNYNFTTAASQAVGNAQATLSGGAFGMYGGNANSNTNTKYIGPTNDQNTLLNSCLLGIVGNTVIGYSPCDLNMNGQVKYIGPGNDQNFLLNVVLGGIVGNIVVQGF
jgi:hypothetical protein